MKGSMAHLNAETSEHEKAHDGCSVCPSQEAAEFQTHL